MRRSYISPEFEYNRVFGTLNMKEESSFFGSKMLEIEDSLELHNQGIVYFQNLLKEQLDLDVEKTSNPIIYLVSDDKKANHTLVLDDSQNDFQKNGLTKYIITIDLKAILENYLFAILKQYRTFEGVKNSMTTYNDVNFAIEEYIRRNVVNRYKYKTIEVYLKYRDIRSQNVLRYQNSWNPNITQTENLLKKVQTETSYDETSIKVMFTQEKPSDQYSFEYFFNLVFEKL